MIAGFTSCVAQGFFALFIGVWLINKVERNGRKNRGSLSSTTGGLGDKSDVETSTMCGIPSEEPALHLNLSTQSIVSLTPSGSCQGPDGRGNNPNVLKLSVNGPSSVVSDSENPDKMKFDLKAIKKGLNSFLKQQHNYQLFAG